MTYLQTVAPKYIADVSTENVKYLVRNKKQVCYKFIEINMSLDCKNLRN